MDCRSGILWVIVDGRGLCPHEYISIDISVDA